MTEDFALIDFLLTSAAPQDVAQALDMVASSAELRPDARAAPGKAGQGGLMARLGFGSGRSGRASRRALRVQPKGRLPPSPLARARIGDPDVGRGETPFRISFPMGPARLTLVEFREDDRPASAVAAALSAAQPETDVFYFRLSGERHPGSETAFHVYRSGAPIRRAASICPQGTTTEDEWHFVDSGLPHLIEADSLPALREEPWEIMTPERQGRILTAMGLDPDALFVETAGRMVLDLSSEAGGALLDDSSGFFPAQTPAQPPTPVAPVQPEPTQPAVHALPEAALAARSVLPTADETWEAEVTRLLVTAVAHALPEDERIPWLTELTARLEAGDVEEALADARALIDVGDRPAAERLADTARLDALFGVDQAGVVAGDVPRGPPST
ncbi:MAG: hypothetical protein AAF646_08075 [Pseudomonadota bacterium]